MLLIGSHVSFKKDKQLLGSLEEALNYGSNTFMFYTGELQSTHRYLINDEYTKLAHEKIKQQHINIDNILVHAPFIINLANDKKVEQYNFSIDFLISECKRCEKLGIKYLIVHPGNHSGNGIESGIASTINALNIILEKTDVMILIETMAGKGSEIGSTIEEIKQIIDNVKNKKQIGVCLDTCHLADSGYDIKNFDDFLTKFDILIDIDKIKCIHINDSKNIQGSKKDRHANIGFGNLGFDNIINIIYNEKLKDVPKILETPYVNIYPPYKFEIEMIKNKRFNPNMLEDIENYYK